MVALAGAKPIKTRPGTQLSVSLKAGIKVWAGAIAVLTSAGVAQAAATATGLRCIGYFESDADNTTGGDGAVVASVRKDVALCVNSTSTDALAAADINAVCYLVDDQTVAKTNGTGTRSAAGRVVDVTPEGVWVALGEPAMPTT